MKDSVANRSTTCAVCERLILPGERMTMFRDLDRGGRRCPTCPLCRRAAIERGWTRDDRSEQSGRSGSAA